MRRKLKLEELNRLTPEEFRHSEKIPLIFILDNIRSGLNVGSAFRTADAFGIRKMYLCGITAQPPHREILKTAIGANESIEWVYVKDIVSLCERLKADGYFLIGLEQTEDSRNLLSYDFPLDREVALVFGNEVEGISVEILEYLDQVLEIPQYGTKHSLNVSVSIGIASAFYRQQWDQK